MTNAVSQSCAGIGLIYQKTKSDPARDLWAEILAPFEAKLKLFTAQSSPTCLDTFLQWSQDANPGGFSAKMLLHLTLWSFKPDYRADGTNGIHALRLAIVEFGRGR